MRRASSGLTRGRHGVDDRQLVGDGPRRPRGPRPRPQPCPGAWTMTLAGSGDGRVREEGRCSTGPNAVAKACVAARPKSATRIQEVLPVTALMIALSLRMTSRPPDSIPPPPLVVIVAPYCWATGLTTVTPDPMDGAMTRLRAPPSGASPECSGARDGVGPGVAVAPGEPVAPGIAGAPGIAVAPGIATGPRVVAAGRGVGPDSSSCRLPPGPSGSSCRSRPGRPARRSAASPPGPRRCRARCWRSRCGPRGRRPTPFTRPAPCWNTL